MKTRKAERCPSCGGALRAGWREDVIRGGGRTLTVLQPVKRCARCRTMFGSHLVGNGLHDGFLLVDHVPWSETYGETRARLADDRRRIAARSARKTTS